MKYISKDKTKVAAVEFLAEVPFEFFDTKITAVWDKFIEKIDALPVVELGEPEENE